MDGMEDETMDLAGIMDSLETKRPRGSKSRPHASRKLFVGQVEHDSNPGQSSNKSFARTVRLRCVRCGVSWSAVYEGPQPRHRDDLICHKCTK